MKIATYNVNSVNARMENLTAWLKTAEPDAVLLQEIKCDDGNFPFFELRAAGYEVKMLGQKSYNGVAVLCRKPLTVVREGLPGLTDANARYLEVQTELDGSPWRLASVYLPNGNPPYNNPADKSKLAYKLQWFDAFLAHAAELQKLSVPVVLGGDFNVILTPKDVYDSRPFIHDALFLPEVRKRLRMLEYAGFYDAFRMLHPDDPGYTFWDYTGNALAADFGMRIDYLFLNAPAADRLTVCAVDKSPRLDAKPSDHTALVSEFACSAPR